jgi:histidinol-phosphatase
MGRTEERGSRGVPRTEELLRVARTAAVAGGRRTLESFGRRLRPEIKPDGSPVTRADRATEREIRRVLRRAYPGHSIVGEEGGLSDRGSPVQWVIDPIDGTASYIHGVPLYAVLVAATVRGRSVAGVIHLPALGETIEAAIGHGCRWNGRPARVSSTTRLSEATLLTTSVRALEDSGVPFRRLSSASHRQRTWGDAYGHALVATGRADAMVDTGLKIWDVAALIPVLTEAGGRITDWRGALNPIPGNAVSSNGRLHEAVLECLRS